MDSNAAPGFWRRVDELFHTIDNRGNGDGRISRDELVKHFKVPMLFFESLWNQNLQIKATIKTLPRSLILTLLFCANDLCTGQHS